ncbi:TPA: hypothetical protein QCR38_000750 [Bacillus cereus]|nr:hypothetical protein [Bacillus cereus]
MNMGNEPKFITEEQRETLKKIQILIENIQNNITYEHEEYFLIRSILGDLKNAIKCKEEFY